MLPQLFLAENQIFAPAVKFIMNKNMKTTSAGHACTSPPHHSSDTDVEATTPSHREVEKYRLRKRLNSSLPVQQQ